MYNYFQVKLAIIILVALAESAYCQGDRLDLHSLNPHSNFEVQKLGNVHRIVKDNHHYCFRREKLLHKSKSVASRLIKFGPKVELVSVVELRRGFYEFSWTDFDKLKVRKSKKLGLGDFEIVQIYATNDSEILLISCSQTAGNDSVVMWDTKSNLVSLVGWDRGRFLNVTDWIGTGEISEQFDSKFNTWNAPPSIESVNRCVDGVIVATSEDALEYVPFSDVRKNRGRGKCPWEISDASSLATFEVLDSNFDGKPSSEKSRRELTLTAFAGIGIQKQLVNLFYLFPKGKGKGTRLCWARWSPQENQKQGTPKTFNLQSDQDISLINCTGSKVSVLQAIKSTGPNSEINGFTIFQGDCDSLEKGRIVSFNSARLNGKCVDAVLYDNLVYVIQKDRKELAVFSYDISEEAIAKLIGVLR